MCILGYHNWRIIDRDGKYTAACSRCGISKLVTKKEAEELNGEIMTPSYNLKNSELVALDVGCGFMDGIQVPVYARVSLDLNMNHVEPAFLEKLNTNGCCPLNADAVNLPIRNSCIHKIHWRAVLEHFPDPHTAIMEGKRVLKNGGEAEIVLPMITSHMRHFLIIIWTQFPISIIPIAMQLWKAHLYWHQPGVPHIRDVKPKHIERYFTNVSTIAYPKTHKWFRGPWSRFTKLLTNGRELPDIQGQYLIKGVKVKRHQIRDL